MTTEALVAPPRASIIQRARGDPLVRGSAVLLVFTSVTNVLLYGFHLALGRVLTPAEFGIATACFAILTFATRPFEVLEMVSAHYVARLRNDPPSLARTVRRLRRLALGAGTVLFLVLVALAEPISARLGAHPRLFWVVAATAALVPLYTLYRGSLQGAQAYQHYGWARMIPAIVRIVVGVGLVIAGAGVIGALLGPFAGFAVAIVFIGLVAPRLAPSGTEGKDERLIGFALPAVAAFFGFSALTTVPLLAVKVIFPEHEAGIFAAAFVLGEVVLYLPAAIGLALFPIMSSRARSDRNPRLLARAIVLTLAPSVAAVAVFFVGADAIVGIVLGPEYLEAAPVIPIIAIAMAFAGVVNVIVQYQTALRSFVYPLTLVGFAIGEVILVTVYHASLHQVSVILAIVCGAAAATGAFLAFRRGAEPKA